jgi:MFS family permease
LSLTKSACFRQRSLVEYTESLRSLLRIPSFRSLLAGQALASASHQVAAFALPTLAITRLNATAFEVGVLTALAFVPTTMFGFLAGVIADRMPRRALMVAADLGRALVIGLVAIGMIWQTLTLGQLYVAAAGMGLLALLFDVAYQSHVPDLVDAETLPKANGALEINRSAGTVMGPALSGGLIQAIGIAGALVTAAGGLLLSIGVLARGLQWPAKAAASRAPRRAGVYADVLEGLRAVLGDSRLRSIALCTATSNLGAFAFWSVGLVFAYRTLGLSPGEYGVIAAIGNVGLVGGAVVAAPLARRFGVGPTLFVAAALLGASMLATPLAVVGLAGVVLAVTQVMTNFQLPVYGVNQVALRQSLTPRDLQGRMNSIMRTVAVSAIPVGSLAGGALATAFGPIPAMAAGGLVACLAPLWLLGLLSMRSLPVAPEGEPA